MHINLGCLPDSQYSRKVDSKILMISYMSTIIQFMGTFENNT